MGCLKGHKCFQGMQGNVLAYIFNNRGCKSGLYLSVSAKWPMIDDLLCRELKSDEIKLLMDILLYDEKLSPISE